MARLSAVPFEGLLFGGKVASSSGGPPHTCMERLHCVRRVDHLSDLGGVVQERHELGPGVLPESDDRWVLLTPDLGEAWCERIEWATLDLSGPYKKVFDTMLPDVPRSLTRSRSYGWRTRNWMSAAGESRTRRSAIEAAKTTRCTGSGGSSPRPTNDSPTTAVPDCWGCWLPVTRKAR